MSHYDFGNFNRDKDFSLYQIGKARKALEEKKALERQEKEAVKEQVFEQKQVDANSLEALGNYGVAFSGMNKKADVSELGLTAHDELKIGKFVNAEQQTRIEQDMLKYFE